MLMKNARRNFLKTTALAIAGTTLWKPLQALGRNTSKRRSEIQPTDGVFSLPALPYSFDALEPVIDTQTMNIHWDKHHRAYVNNLNAALEKEPSLKTKSLEELLGGIGSLPDTVKTSIRNNAGGHWNHTFFWNILSPYKDLPIELQTKNAILLKWTTLDSFYAEFQKAGLSVFGSGWVWLIRDASGVLSIVTTPNQDNPLMDVTTAKGTPILGVDVWEHAYYLKHQNLRADYLKNIWQVINWKKVEQIYSAR